MATWTGILGNILLFMLCFGMSATVEIDRMQQQARNYKALATGILCQFLVLPFLGFLVVRTLDLPESLGLTLLVVTSSPGGSYSNWWCSVFNADLALSVTMTALSTILSILFLPANLLLYTRLTYHDDGLVSVLDWSSLFIALGVVLTAVAAGLTCSYYNKDPSIQKMANHLGNFAGFALIVFSAAMTNTGDADSKIWSRDWKFYVGVSLPCLGGLLLANLIGTALQLRRPERVTVAIECCYQNVGIATSLALTMFEGNDLNDAMGVPFFYGLVEAVAVGIYVLGAWKAGWTKAPAHAPIWLVMWTSYEVLHQEKLEGEDVVDGIEINISESDNLSRPPGSDWQDGNILTTFIWWDNRTEEEQLEAKKQQTANAPLV